ncbi:uncharacterized protein LOC142775155 [Rhipicephalus microplus]|uniref:uncharacterized protein LOC142775155 n=1 Tax=Rhipicephalus microplus TaxID=6941 RepID=UPI003F6B7477
MSQDEHNNTAPSTPPAPLGMPSWTVTAPQKDPPMFSGLRSEDVEDWLDEYDRVRALNYWHDSVKLSRVPFYLTGVAKTWFLNHQLHFPDWPTFEQQLRQIFANPSVRADIAKRKLAERVQHSCESYTSYIEDVLALCRRVDSSMAEHDRVCPVLKGIGAVAFNALAARNPTMNADIITTLPSFQAWRPSRPICSYCGIRGHISRFCRRR